MRIQEANVLLGVTGGIASYKSVDLCSKLIQAGAGVDVVMTEAATHFITPLPFQTLTKRPVAVSMFQLLHDTDMAHISLAKKADVIIIAPATANTIAKIAHGLADNLLTSTVLASTAPLIIAPAMDADMWANPATQANSAALCERDVTFVGPEQGRLASGRLGLGRLSDTATILGTIRQVLGRDGPLAGVQVVVTAGGTQEALDPVRHIGNRSSGRMGYALAEAARDHGAQVTLITTPTCLAPVTRVRTVAVRSASEMHRAVVEACAQADILIMAAAVADYRPTAPAAHKIKKTEGALVLELERTIDILASLATSAERPELVIGFAAETENLLQNAAAKLDRKALDMIVANDVSSHDSGFEVDTNRVTLLTADGEIEKLPLMAKSEVAEQVMGRISRMWKERHA